jgi:hypothetical protein
MDLGVSENGHAPPHFRDESSISELQGVFQLVSGSHIIAQL